MHRQKLSTGCPQVSYPQVINSLLSTGYQQPVNGLTNQGGNQELSTGYQQPGGQSRVIHRLCTDFQLLTIHTQVVNRLLTAYKQVVHSLLSTGYAQPAIRLTCQLASYSQVINRLVYTSIHFRQEKALSRLLSSVLSTLLCHVVRRGVVSIAIIAIIL